MCAACVMHVSRPSRAAVSCRTLAGMAAHEREAGRIRRPGGESRGSGEGLRLESRYVGCDGMRAAVRGCEFRFSSAR
eukprot:960406-Prymnesium_polylepis.4